MLLYLNHWTTKKTIPFFTSTTLFFSLSESRRSPLFSSLAWEEDEEDEEDEDEDEEDEEEEERLRLPSLPLRLSSPSYAFSEIFPSETGVNVFSYTILSELLILALTFNAGLPEMVECVKV